MGIMEAGAGHKKKANTVSSVPPDETNAPTSPEIASGAMAGLAPLGPDGGWVIPAEDFGDPVCGNEMDMDAEVGLKIRKPKRHEFSKIAQGGIANTRLLYLQESEESREDKPHFVAPALRGRIADSISDVHVVLCYSLSDNRFFLWCVKVSNTDWYRSCAMLLKKTPDYHASHKFRVASDRGAQRYRVITDDDSTVIPKPPGQVLSLLTQALGRDAIIDSAEHPVYQKLTTGDELK